MSDHGWTIGPERPDEPRRRPLPRVEDLPAAEDGYDRAAVEAAFDAFYRHAAELDATLGVLEAVDAFQKQAADLRADIRALRAASWAPAHARQGAAGTYAPRPAPPRPPVLEVMPRMAVEAAFIIIVGVGAALAGLGSAGVILLVLAAWLVVALGEAVAALTRPPVRPALPAPRARPATAEPARVEPAPTQIVSADEVAAAAVAEPEPDVEPEPAAAAAEEEPLPEPVAEEAPKRRFWQRLPRTRDLDEPPPVEAPRHVRVLGAAEADPWEQGPEVAEAAAEAGDEEFAEARPLPLDAVAPPPPEDDAEEEAERAEPEAVTAEPEQEPVAEESGEEPGPVAEPEPVTVRPEMSFAPPEPRPAPVAEEPAQEPEPSEEPEPVAAEPEPEPALDWTAAAAEPEPEPEPEEERATEPVAEPAQEPEPVAEALAEPELEEEPEPVAEEEPAAAEERLADEEAAAGRWRFWRRGGGRREDEPEPAPERPQPPQHVRLIDVEQAVEPDEVEVPWESEPEGGTLSWGVVIEPDESEEAGADAPPGRGRPEPARRRGRR